MQQLSADSSAVAILSTSVFFANFIVASTPYNCYALPKIQDVTLYKPTC